MRIIIAAAMALACAASLPAQDGRYRKIRVNDYREAVYASWIGQIIGNIYGLPHENKYVANPGPATFPYGYGENLSRLRELNGAFSDDDTDIEYVYLRAMEQHGPEPTYEQLSALWKYHFRDKIWIANRAALAAMHYGLTPPLTGRKEYNPHWFQIDPQLINEIWAVTAPGMVRYAARKSAWAAEITNEGWGIEPTVHYGAMYAAAFFERDVTKLIEAGNRALPEGSRFRSAAEHMISLHAKYPGDWRKARAEMSEKYWLGEPAETQTIWNAILNGAAGILALLYGEGDFQKTLDYACAIGFDADNQAATMAGLIAITKGIDGIPRELLMPIPGWTQPFNDRYRNVTRYDLPDAGIREMALRTAKAGEAVVLKNGGRKVVENGVEYLIIDAEAAFNAPLEVPAAPVLMLGVGKPVRYKIPVSPSGVEARWTVSTGSLPGGLTLHPGGVIAGSPAIAGEWDVLVAAAAGKSTASRALHLVVTGANLAPSAAEVLVSAASAGRGLDQRGVRPMPAPWLAESPEMLRDGRLFGPGQTYFAKLTKPGERSVHFGYRWNEEKNVQLVRLTTGVMEEVGWLIHARIEFLNSQGQWETALGQTVSPSMPPGDQPFDKPSQASYLFRFPAIKTRAIRVIGEAPDSRGGSQSGAASVAELEVY